MTPAISVLITAHNAGSTLGGCLESIERSDAGGESRETIVVDDRSSDNTAAVARTTSPEARIVRLDRNERSTLTARQLAIEAGVAAARGDAVLMIDADGLAGGNWSRELSRPLLAGEADLVAGGVIFEPRTNRWKARAIAALQTADAGFYLLVCRLLNAAGFKSGILFGSAGFRRALFDEVGGYRDTGPSLTEDLEFARLAVGRGAHLVFRTRASVRVGACSSITGIIDRALRTSAGGWSALGVILGAWMLLLILLAMSAALAGGVWWAALGLRYGAGALATAVGVRLLGARGSLPAALVYESAAIAIGFAVFLRLRRTAVVHWGGITYDRHRQPREQHI
ncbi:MAG: glycosyltransferase [Gemmatimonadota bacterium]